VVHHPRREVLDHHVGPPDKFVDQADSVGGLQIQRDRPLIGVHGVKDPAVFPPVVDVGAHSTGVSDAVGPLNRLDLDHFRSERRQ